MARVTLIAFLVFGCTKGIRQASDCPPSGPQMAACAKCLWKNGSTGVYEYRPAKDGGRCVRIGDETTALSTVAPAASPPLADDDVTASTPKEVVLDDALTWPRATSRQFGCMLERAGHKDPSFHCGARKPASGDPCKAPEAYSRGPEFPGALAARAVKGAEKIQLGWEHGDLQAVEVDFAPGVDDAAIRKAFGLPGSKQAHPNVMDADVQRCSKDRWCLVLQGFDHMGAGDVDCDEDENPE